MADFDDERTNRWRPTGALLTALLTVLVTLVAGVALRRADLVVVAAPFVVGVGVALTRPLGAPSRDRVRLRVPERPVWEGELVLAELRLDLDESAGGVDLACVGVRHGSGLLVERPGALQVVPVRAGTTTTVRLPTRADHWGRLPFGPAEVTWTAAHGMFARDRPADAAEGIAVVPLRAVFDATDQVPDPAGLVGAHRSRRAGSGTDLLSVRPFQAGDRLRRINWPVSLRTQQLHVTTTTDDRDTDVLLMLDAGIEVGDPDTAAGTSLDVAVRASASVAEHYLRQGDRVGVVDVGRPSTRVRLDAGRRHLLRVLDLLIDSRPDDTTFAVDHFRGPRVSRLLREVPPRALVMVFGPLVDEQAAERIATLGRSGHTVLVIDTLPADVTVPASSEWTPLAWRVALLARENLLLRLDELGVPVVVWRGAGSLDQVLRVLSRAAVVPRRRR